MNNEKQRRGKEIFFAEKKNFLPSVGCESSYQARMNMNGSGAAFFQRQRQHQQQQQQNQIQDQQRYQRQQLNQHHHLLRNTTLKVGNKQCLQNCPEPQIIVWSYLQI